MFRKCYQHFDLLSLQLQVYTNTNLCIAGVSIVLSRAAPHVRVLPLGVSTSPTLVLTSLHTRAF